MKAFIDPLSTQMCPPTQAGGGGCRGRSHLNDLYLASVSIRPTHCRDTGYVFRDIKWLQETAMGKLKIRSPSTILAQLALCSDSRMIQN